jgi:hypothetical protein
MDIDVHVDGQRLAWCFACLNGLHSCCTGCVCGDDAATHLRRTTAA